jgi:hypothetical protein
MPMSELENTAVSPAPPGRRRPRIVADLHEQPLDLEDAQQRAEDHEHEHLVGADGHEQAVKARQAHAQVGDDVVEEKGVWYSGPLSRCPRKK